jgi:hypothetical protein
MYQLTTPTRNQTWGAYPLSTPYARLAGRPISGAGVPTRLTDIPRGVSLLVNGTTVTENMTPSQDALAAADAYYLGGHLYTIDDAAAQILLDAGYSEWLRQL